MPETMESPPRPRRRRLFRLTALLLLAAGAALALDAAGLLPGILRATRLEFAVGADRDTRQATRATVIAERRGDSWTLSLSIDALPGAQRYSLIQLLATREWAPSGEPDLITLHDENRQPLIRGRWEVVATVPNEVFRNRDWVLRYRADTIDALAVSEDIAPFIRQAGATR